MQILTSPAALAEWRGQIDRIDAELVRLLNHRTELSVAIAAWKQGTGTPLTDAGRENEVIRRAQRVSAGPLDATAIELLFQLIMIEAKRTSVRQRVLAGV